MEIYSVGFMKDNKIIKAYGVAADSEEEAEELVKAEIANTPDKIFLKEHFEIIIEKI